MICTDCGSKKLLRDNSRGEVCCEVCGLVIEEGLESEGEDILSMVLNQDGRQSRAGSTITLPDDAKIHTIPPKKKRVMRSLSKGQKALAKSLRESDPGKMKKNPKEKRDPHKDPEYYEAMRRSRAALGLSRWAKAELFDMDKLCPPFVRPMGGDGERINHNDIDSILGKKYLSLTTALYSPVRTRPRRKSDDGWASAEREWLGWEIFSHLTKDMRRPWFWSHWADRMGLGTKASIGPFSRSAVEASGLLPDPAESIEGLCDLLSIFEEIEVPTGVQEESRELLERLTDLLPPQISYPPLYIGGSPIEVHRGKCVAEGEDGSETWVEEGHSEYLMPHIPASFAVAQCLFDSRDYDEAMDLTALLRREVNSCTSTDWSEAHALWVDSLDEIGRNNPFPK